MRLINDPEYKIYHYTNPSNNKLRWKSEDFKMSIQSEEGKEKQLTREIKIKFFFEENIDVLSSQNRFWTKHRDGNDRQSKDWIYYFFNTIKITADTDLHSFTAKEI